MGSVASVKVNDTSTDPEVVFQAVARALELINWEKLMKPGSVILKINAVWDHLYPSCTTSPMVIEGILKTILATKKFRPEDITIVDTDTAAWMR